MKKKSPQAKPWLIVCLLLMSWSSIAQAEMNICKYFPGPVQTWKDNSAGTLTLTGTPFISNAKVIDGKRYVGMNIKAKDNLNYVCNQTQCYPASSQSGLYAADKQFPTWAGKNKIDILIQSQLDKLGPQKNNTYWIDDLYINNIVFPVGSTVYVKKITVSAAVNRNICAVQGTDCTKANPDDLTIYLYKDGTNKLKLNNGANIWAKIYSKQDIIIGKKKNTGIYGAVTAPSVTIAGDSSNQGFIAGQSKCFTNVVPEPIPEIDICKVFPGPVQAWQGVENSKITMENSVQIALTKMINGKHYLGYHSIEQSDLKDLNPKNCDHQTCYPAKNDTLYAKKWDSPIWPQKTDGVINSLSQLNKFLLLPENKHRRVFWFDKITILSVSNGGEVVIVPNGTTIYTKSFAFGAKTETNGWVRIQPESGNPEDLKIYIDSDNSESNNKAEIDGRAIIHGLIYSNRNININTWNRAWNRIFGAITAPNIHIVGNKKPLGREAGIAWVLPSCNAQKIRPEKPQYCSSFTHVVQSTKLDIPNKPVIKVAGDSGIQSSPLGFSLGVNFNPGITPTRIDKNYKKCFVGGFNRSLLCEAYTTGNDLTPHRPYPESFVGCLPCQFSDVPADLPRPKVPDETLLQATNKKPDLTIKENETIILEPNTAYGRIILKNGSKLVLPAGEFYIKDIITKNPSAFNISLEGDAKVYVLNSINIDFPSRPIANQGINVNGLHDLLLYSNKSIEIDTSIPTTVAPLPRPEVYATLYAKDRITLGDVKIHGRVRADGVDYTPSLSYSVIQMTGAASIIDDGPCGFESEPQPKPEPEENICDYFPGPAQSFLPDGKINASHQFNVDGALRKENKYFLGFNQFINNSSAGTANKFCSGEQCFADKALMPKKMEIKEDGNYSPIIENQQQLDALIKKNSSKSLFIDAISLTNNNLIFPDSYKVYVKALNMVQSSIRSQSGTPDDLVIIIVNKKPVATNVFAKFQLGNGAEVKALIYSERDLEMSNGKDKSTTITGAVTAPNVIATGNSTDYGSNKSEIIGKSRCFVPSKPIHELSITLAKQSPTLCDEQIVTFNVTPDIEKADIAVSLSMVSGGQYSVDGKTFIDIPTDTISLPVQNNKAQLWLRSNDAGNVTINAHLSSDESVKANSNYDVLPADKLYLVASTVNDHIVAGKPFDVDVEVKQCSADFTQKTATHFNGNVTSVSTDYIQPKSGNVKVEWDNSPVKITNGKGEKSLKLHYSDAGKIQLKVNANGINEDKKGNKQDITLTSNGLDLYFRPWTFAVCPLTLYSKDKIRTADGTASGGEKFTQAGAPFDVLLKPLVWVESLDKPKVNNEYNVFAKEYCEASVTENFLANDAPSIDNLKVSATLDTPKNGVLGDFYSGDNQVKNTTLKGIVIQHNHWDDVGSINYHVSLDNYMGFDDMDVDPSYRRIGRFYPAYFQLENNSVEPAMGNFTYMNQPFSAKFSVFAYNQQESKLTNYHLFADALKSKMQLVVMANGKDLADRYQPKLFDVNKWGASSNNKKDAYSVFNYVAEGNAKFLRHYIDRSSKTSKEDGPYPDWQLRVRQTTTPDGVIWFDKSDSELVGTNDLRYGRMVLDDAAGDLNQTLTIPLRVEYWDGSEFVTNTDDSISRFDGANYCRKILFPAKANNVPYTKGAGHVTLGDVILSHLVATHDDENKEKQQVRFWQRIGESIPANIDDCQGSYINLPWLRYNWRGLGDEDPSATVTFGVYHGNDRIIYRDEVNLDNKPIPYVDYQ